MRFLLLGIGSLFPDPFTGKVPTAADRLDQVVTDAVFAEEIGIDAFGVGERHSGLWSVTAPPVVLSAVAGRTSRIRLMTTVSVLGVRDPVRFAEDYATVDQISRGRLELIIGRGSEPHLYPLFGLPMDRIHDINSEKYELLERLWTEEDVLWSGEFRPPLHGVTTWPRPYQGLPPVWHGSASSPETAELAARHGNPLFTANALGPATGYARVVDYYRSQWALMGRDPAAAVVGGGSSVFYVARTSQEALKAAQPYFDATMRQIFRGRIASPSLPVEATRAGAALVGSPEQIIDKILWWHELFGHSVQQLSLDVVGSMPASQQRATLELFMSEVAPVLRREAPTTLWSEPADGAGPAEVDGSKGAPRSSASAGVPGGARTREEATHG